MKDYEKIFGTATEFFSECNPDLIEDALLQHLTEKEQVEPTSVSQDHYKVKF